MVAVRMGPPDSCEALHDPRAAQEPEHAGLPAIERTTAAAAAGVPPPKLPATLLQRTTAAAAAIDIVGAGTIIKDNHGFNPVGKIANAFDTTNDRIEIGGDAAVPAASTVYTVCNMDVLISSTDSGSADNAILIKDPGGNVINPAALSTLDAYYVPRNHQVDWGAYTGAAPTVVVSFV